MQLFALDKNKHLISAAQAERKTNYFCRECSRLVRLRGGMHTQLHFYHLASTDACRLNQKSLIHIQTQHYIHGILPQGEAALERQFPEIGRIADVVWEIPRVVFEIQCSPISKEEVESRNRDYKSLGYKVIWILHENRFNRWKASTAEMFLRLSPYYFTNMDRQGKGCIYDQLDVMHGGIRRTFRRIMDVQLNQPQSINKQVECAWLPEILKDRLAAWEIHFSGDLIDLWMRNEAQDYMLQAMQFEKSIYKQAMNPILAYFRKGFYYGFVRPYKLFFQMILEKSCK